MVYSTCFVNISIDFTLKKLLANNSPDLRLQLLLVNINTDFSIAKHVGEYQAGSQPSKLDGEYWHCDFSPHNLLVNPSPRISAGIWLGVSQPGGQGDGQQVVPAPRLGLGHHSSGSGRRQNKVVFLFRCFTYIKICFNCRIFGQRQTPLFFTS